MTAAELIHTLEQQGFSLLPLPEGKLAVKPAEKLTDELREKIRQRKAELLTLLTQPSQLKDRYHRTAEAIAEDCFSIDPTWLIENRPILWKRLCWLDERATEIEQKGKSEEDYQSVLKSLVALVREAREAYERACNEKIAVNQ